MPTWSNASDRSRASALAVAIPASTGPIPQQSDAAPSTETSSRSVAATTRITVEPCLNSAHGRRGLEQRDPGLPEGDLQAPDGRREGHHHPPCQAPARLARFGQRDGEEAG